MFSVYRLALADGCDDGRPTTSKMLLGGLWINSLMRNNLQQFRRTALMLD
jgi:hypothetical protein